METKFKYGDKVYLPKSKQGIRGKMGNVHKRAIEKKQDFLYITYLPKDKEKIYFLDVNLNKNDGDFYYLEELVLFQNSYEIF